MVLISKTISHQPCTLSTRSQQMCTLIFNCVVFKKKKYIQEKSPILYGKLRTRMLKHVRRNNFRNCFGIRKLETALKTENE